MAVLFSIHLSNSRKCFGKPSVRAIEPAALAGVYDEEAAATFRPDPQAVRDCLPAAWRAAYDRSQWWFAREGRLDAAGQFHGHTSPYIKLHDARGRYINTVYAIPYRFESEAAR